MKLCVMKYNMEDSQQEPQGTKTSLRGRLVQAVLEEYIDSIMFEPIEWDRMEAGLQNLLSDMLAFETKVTLNKTDEMTDKCVFSGTITLQDHHEGELKNATISFAW